MNLLGSKVLAELEVEGSVLSLILVERLLDEILSLVFLEVSTSGCCWFK